MPLPAMTRLLPLLLLLSLTPLAPATAADAPPDIGCGAGPGGAPCGGSGPASQGNSSGTNQGAGNPINVTNGNKYQQETDLPALPGILGLEIVRHYNSAHAGPGAPNGILGRGWRLSYETDLHAIGNSVQIIEADGTRLIFSRDPGTPGTCASNDPSQGRIHIRKTPRGDEYAWHWPSGRRLDFDNRGKLVQIQAPSGEYVSLQHDAQGHLVKVTDPQGRTLQLNYLDRKHAQAGDRYRGVQSIDSPVGRYSYEYGSAAPTGATGNPRDRLANLVKVSLPTHHEAQQKAHAHATRGYTSSSISRHYHYEDPRHPTHLTGITVSGIGSDGRLLHQRTGSYRYDDKGRGIQSVKGPPRQQDKDGHPLPGSGIEQVDLQYGPPAHPQGQPGTTVLTNSLGQKTTYTHTLINEQSRLLEIRGPGCASCGESNLRYAYDKLGRMTEATRLGPQGQPIHTTRTERDGQGRPIKISAIAYRNGHAQPSQTQARYQYAGEGAQPTLIARPSINPGQEHQIRISYNPAGQVLSVTESGYSPLDEKGQATATPISRTTSYTYQSINGRSVLAQIDGPLRNGPKNSPADSDITLIQHDGRGSFVTAMTPPGGFASTVQHDEAGRIAAVSNAQNFKTTFTYDARNQLVHVSSSGANWAQAGIEPVEQSWRHDALGNRVESGSGSGKTYRPQTRQAYDVAGRLLWQAEALGILKRASYDSEGHLLAGTVQTNSFEQTERYRYDDLNRLIQIADNTGSVRNIAYGKTADPQRTRRQSAFQIFRDDFGREVMVKSASHGTLIKRYDETDQLIEQINDKGDTQTWAYSPTGQRTRHSVLPKTGAAETTTWRHEQGRLAEVIDPVQSERIRYNERGQPETKTVTLKLANGAEATHITRYAYTADGSLQSQSLPDGTKILYERNGQGQVVAVTRQTSPWTFSGWGKTTLVKDLERDLIGLRQVTYGNGIRGQWQRSREGVLARVVYTQPEGRAPAKLAGLLDRLVPPAHAQATPAAPAAPGKLPGALGLPANPQALFDARLLYDGNGNVLLQKQQGQGSQATQAYAYDRQSQLIAAQTARPAPPAKTTATEADRVWRYHYDRNGNRVLAQENVPVTELGQTRKASYDPESHAMTTPDLSREYVWNAQGRLIHIRQENRELARYRYNHHGLRVSKQTGSEAAHTLYNEQRQRIADLDAEGKITRQYLWLGDQLIATLDARQPKAPQAPAEGFLAELTQTARALWNSASGNTDRLAFAHVNHLGAPVAATDEAGQPVWQAGYAPYGKLIKASASTSGKRAYTLALRLPGQWQDDESGLYYNDQRYYDPQSGRYLSPDPLGRLAEALGSPNAYSYVNNNPLSYIDPWGLILFAFDGTGNDESNPNALSNVVRFRDAYQTSGEHVRYITGVGTEHVDAQYGNIKHWGGNTVDSGANYTGPARIARMVQYFNDEADAFDDETAMDVDLIGFSRGAAQARDFSNRLVNSLNNGYYRYTITGQDGKEETRCQKVNFRFMGLWDTVLSTNWSGYSYNLGIPKEFAYVAQAVALNEFRGNGVLYRPAGSVGAFPLESIMDGVYSPVPTPGMTRIERGFLGSHSDIGGGFAQGDLSSIALAWMVDQATAAGVSMSVPPGTIIANPVLHDKSDAMRYGQPQANSEDRTVRYRNGQTTTQRNMPVPAGMSYADTNQFINYGPRYGADYVTGTVDAKAYLAWLNANGYNINMTVSP